MSNNKKSGKGMQRIIVWILVALMVLGMVIPSLISVFTLKASAAYDINYTDELIVRIGLLYGSSVVSAFQTKSPYGFKVLAVDKETDAPTELYTLSTTVLESVVEENLAIVNRDYKIANGGSYDIGAYRAMLDAPLTLEELYKAMRTAVMNGIEEPIIPSYCGGAYRLLFGSFGDEDEAEEYIEEVSDVFEDFEIDGELYEDIVVYEPTKTAIMLIDYETDEVVFEFDGKETEELAIAALDSPEGERAYLQTPANKLYDGLFVFTRYNDGVQLVNLIGFEDYVKGVLPYEIGNSWPLETQKAFAISVRSYTLCKLERHKTSYGFNLCNTVCCQAYGGVRLVNDTVVEAVEATRGLVLKDMDDNVVATYYSAVAGGTTVSAEAAWGGTSAKYLQAFKTPWEDYSGHPNGTWTWSVSPQKLREVLNAKGFGTIKAPIDDIDVEYAENSDYVYKITFTDTKGNTATIKNTDTVRTKLSEFLRSANFKVGQGSLTVNDPAFDGDSAKILFSRINGDKISYVKWTEPLKVLTADGEKNAWAGVDLPVLTGKNEIEYVDRSVRLEADDEDDFLFVGRGWGHGVGLSQVGAYNLGQQGFDYEFILMSYFADTYVDHYDLEKYKEVIDDDEEYEDEDDYEDEEDEEDE